MSEEDIILKIRSNIIPIMQNLLALHIPINNYILHRCWYRYEAMLVEYLIQKNYIKRDGMFYNQIGTRINNQHIQKPIKSPDNTNTEEFYVYARCTHIKFNWKQIKQDVPANLFD
jgi:hypothetical protein